jgi:hypothetical protein
MIPITILYVWSFPYFERLNNPNELVRVYMTLAIVDDGTYDITEVCNRYTWVNDRSAVGQRAYSSKAPGASLAGVPVYAVAKLLGKLTGQPPSLRETVWSLRLAVSVIPAILFLFFFRRMLGSLTERGFVRDLVFVGTAIATPAFTYIHQFAGHTPSACALFGSYILLSGARRAGRWSPAGAAGFGLLLATAPVMEYQALVPSIVVGLAFVVSRVSWHKVPLASAAAAGAIPLGLLAHFHWAAFGSPLSTGYAYIENPAFQMLLSEGWMGLTYPRMGRLVQLLLSTDTGLLIFSPMLGFGLVLGPLASWMRQRGLFDEHRAHAAVVSALVVISLILFISANILWRAGWTAGPRYLTALVPFAAVLALFGLDGADRLWGWPVRVIAAATLFFGFLMSGISGAFYPHLPVTFANPVFEVLLPLIRDGFVPRNLGYLLGLRGLSGYLPAVALGLAPLVALLTVQAHRSNANRLSFLLTSVLVFALACQPFSRLAKHSQMPQWGIDDLMAVYSTWEPLDNVTYFERHGCTVGDTIWRIECPDRLTSGRVEMRLGLRWLAAIRYRTIGAGGGLPAVSGVVPPRPVPLAKPQSRTSIKSSDGS